MNTVDALQWLQKAVWYRQPGLRKHDLAFEAVVEGILKAQAIWDGPDSVYEDTEDRPVSDFKWGDKFGDISALVNTLDTSRARNWEANGKIILAACDTAYEDANGIIKVVDCIPQLAYVLATTSHESLFAPIREYTFDKPWNDAAIRYFTANYEWRSDLGNTQAGDGAKYAGRGFVQLTGRRNYTLFTEILKANGMDADLVNDPDRALNPDIAAFVMVYGMLFGSFTGVGMGQYLKPGKVDYYNARRVVNGVDKAELIAGYARAYEGVLA